MEGGLEFEFPEPIIHHIQSLLTGKEAARTTILSKAWHSAWLTLPHLVFDETDFMAKGEQTLPSSDEFLKYVKNRIDWYEQSNLKIDSLKLRMSACDDASLIVKALLKLGATRLSFHLISGRGPVVFPQEVLFGDNNLVELSVQGHCEIFLQGTTEIKLESLCLKDVHFTSDTMPVGLMNTNLDRLRCLELCYGSFKSLFPGDLLSKFPLLTDFTILVRPYMLDSFAQVEITSRSLERAKLLLVGRKIDEVGVCRVSLKLDVPNIRKFTFESSDGVFPSLSVVSCSSAIREWESHVCVTQYCGLTAAWFGVLNNFLSELRQSKIHLSVQVECREGFDYALGDVESVVVRKHELENLSIGTSRGKPSFFCNALFDGLFRFFRPKIITLDQEKKYGFYYGGQNPTKRQIIFDKLCELLDQGIRLKVSDPGLFLCDLEEANAQIFDDDRPMGWRPPIQLKSLLDDQGQHQRVRLLLKWKP